MTLSKIRESVLSARISWINDMLAGIEQLSFDTFEDFLSDKRNIASAESYLRRALEALMDLGRHIIAKGFAVDVPDYKSISVKLNEFNIINSGVALKMKILAGYRNRMVHFYNEISNQELYDICSNDIYDIKIVLNEIIVWINNNPKMIDKKL